MLRALLLWLIGMAHLLAGRMRKAFGGIRGPASSRLAKRFPGAPDHWLRDIAPKLPDAEGWLAWDAAKNEEETLVDDEAPIDHVEAGPSGERYRTTRSASSLRPRRPVAVPKASLYPPRVATTHHGGPANGSAAAAHVSRSFVAFPPRQGPSTRPSAAMNPSPSRPPMPSFAPARPSRQANGPAQTYAEDEGFSRIATSMSNRLPLQSAGSAWPDFANASPPEEMLREAPAGGSKRPAMPYPGPSMTSGRVSSPPNSSEMPDTATGVPAKSPQFEGDSIVPRMTALPFDAVEAPWPILAPEGQGADFLPRLRPDVDRLRSGQDSSRWSE